MTAVIPARDEAECVGETVASLLRQNYPGAFNVIVVDDQSRDATADVAREAAAALGAADRLTVLSAGRLCRRAGPENSGRSSRASNLPTTQRRRRPICC